MIVERNVEHLHRYLVQIGQQTNGGGGEVEEWLSGAGAPAGATGSVGDWYLNTVSGDVYEKTDVTTWTLRANIKGPTGATGATGAQGPQGIQGPQGATGAQGVAGTPGEVWFTGAGVPPGATGIVGDWYLNSSNGDYYEKTGASTWTLRGNLRGPQGVQGIQGIQGPIGPQGPEGDPGPQGEIGPMGPMGTVYDSDQIGTVKSFSGATIPTNWMLADGRSLLRSSYPELFAAIGTMYGAADSTHFNIPDLRSRMIYGATTPAGQGAVGGAATHTLAASEMPVHSHTVNAHNHGGGDHAHSIPIRAASFQGGPFPPTGSAGADSSVASYGSGVIISAESPGTNNAGSGGAHNNMPPYILIAQIIKVTGAQIDGAGALVGPQGPAGVQGPAGPEGPMGPEGPPGEAGEGAPVYEQPATPTEPIEIGSLWIDTDESPPQWGPTIPLVTSLPGSPFDGQEVYYPVGAGTVWHLRYRASLPDYRWEFVGGPPLTAYVYTNETRASAVEGDLATVGPQATVPLAGIYEVSWGGRIQLLVAGVAEAWMVLYVGASSSTWSASMIPTAQYGGGSVGQSLVGVLSPAGVVVKVRYSTQGGLQFSFAQRWLKITPLRVG